MKKAPERKGLFKKWGLINAEISGNTTELFFLRCGQLVNIWGSTNLLFLYINKLSINTLFY